MLPYFFSACLALALSVFAQAQNPSGSQRVWVVKVGSPTNQLIFAPNNIQAKAGDMVQFQYYSMNHSVAASTFDQPCFPIAQASPNAVDMKAFWSGFMPTMDQGDLVFSIAVTDTKPIYFYCSQGKHCQLGMVGAINAPTTGNTLEAYKQKAAQAPQNVSPNGAPATTTGFGSSTSPNASQSTGGASVLQQGSWALVCAAAIALLLL